MVIVLKMERALLTATVHCASLSSGVTFLSSFSL